jgi:SAM-dependent methyltransferase
LIARLRSWLTDPRARNLDVDSADFSLAHREVLKSKPLVRELFMHFYRRCRALDDRHFRGTGARLEIGSGSGFMGDVYPDVITSDVKHLPFVRLVARGEQLPFANASLRAIYGINTFHHFPDPRAFLREATRVLAPGGGIVLIEPYHGPAARALFSNLHASEYFDTRGEWTTAATGPFSNANQALSYIVFDRDRAMFEREFPRLRIVSDEPHTHLSYLLSGGVNFRQLVPSALGGLIRRTETLLSPLDRFLALQHTLVLQKTP